MERKKRNNLIIITLIIITISSFLYFDIRLTGYKREKIENFYYLPSGKYLNIISFGFNNVFADFLWMNTLTYVGAHIESDQKYTYLYHMLDIITRINPYFHYPYYFAGTIIPWELHQYDKAITILRRGNKYLPDDWMIWFHEGFIYMYFLNNYKKAAYYFKEASRQKDCPNYVATLAAKLIAKSYDVNTAIKTFYTMYKQTKEEHIKKRLKEKLKLLYAERNFQIFDKALKEYETKYGKPPEKLEDLVNSGILKSIPQEPFGGKYYIDENGKVKSTKYNKRIEIYRKKK